MKVPKWFKIDNNLIINLEKVVSFYREGDTKITVFYASGTNLSSSSITFPNKDTRDKAFDEIFNYVSEIK